MHFCLWASLCMYWYWYMNEHTVMAICCRENALKGIRGTPPMCSKFQLNGVLLSDSYTH